MRQIRRFARVGRYEITDYATTRMVERDILPRDVESALCRAHACLLAESGRWLVTGPDVGGEAIGIVVELSRQMIVVTLFRGDE